MKPQPKNIWANIFLTLTVMVLFFAVMEVVLRLTVYNFKNYPVSPGPNSVYPIESAEFKTIVKINSLNMRDAEISPKAPAEFRILCLGDSFTFGLGVNIEETYPKVLEANLRKQNRNLSVIDGGTAGNAHEAYRFLMEKGLSFQPDLVTVQIYVGNDFYDGMNRSSLRGPEGAEAIPLHSVQSLNLKAIALRLKLRTLEFLWTRLIQIKFIDDWLYERNLRYDNRGIFLRKYPSLEQRLVEMELEDLARIWMQCRKQNIRLAVVIVPTKQQLFKKRFLDNEKYDYRKPNQLLREFLASHGVPVLDFLELYEALSENKLREFYFTKDRHWTVGGHDFAARALENFIKENFGGDHQISR